MTRDPGAELRNRWRLAWLLKRAGQLTPDDARAKLRGPAWRPAPRHWSAGPARHTREWASVRKGGAHPCCRAQGSRIWPGLPRASKNLSLQAGLGVAIQGDMDHCFGTSPWVATSQTLPAMTRRANAVALGSSQPRLRQSAPLCLRPATHPAQRGRFLVAAAECRHRPQPPMPGATPLRSGHPVRSAAAWTA